MLLASLPALTAQALGTLRVTVALDDAGTRTPIARHALLISDDPPTSAPRRVVTRADGTTDITLPPGAYIVESDQPVSFAGTSYGWTVRTQVVAARATDLVLSQETAEVVPIVRPADTPPSPAPNDPNDPSVIHARWQGSVVAVWTEMTRSSGVIADARGLVLTSQRAIGRATSAEVQLTPYLKVAARVVVADVTRNVAVLRVDPTITHTVTPLAPACEAIAATAVATLRDGQDLIALGVPLRGRKDFSWGKVELQPRRVIADLRMDAEEKGGPAFSTAGALVGLTSGTDDPADSADDVLIVGVAEICAALRSAEGQAIGTAAPGGAPLPVEPDKAFADPAVDEASKRRVSDAIPYRISSADFDISFITPVLIRAAERRWQQAGRRNLEGIARLPDEAQERVRLLTEFGHWSDYFEDFPALLLVRVTPKLEERFWTKVARGAATAKGVALPPLPTLGSGFARLRAFCGEGEVTPVHPFRLAHQLDEQTTTHEGLYLFRADSLGPHCASVRLLIASEKDSARFETRIIDPKVVQMWWDDFASYRALSPG